MMRTQWPKSTIEEVLRQDPEIVAIHWPRDWQFGTVNNSLWSKDVEKRQYHIQLLEEYLKTPCIEDTFEGNFSARKNWKGRGRDDWRWYHLKQQDALRWGRMRTIPYFCESLLSNYQGGNDNNIVELTGAITGIVPQTYIEYDKLSAGGKILLVDSLKEQVYTLLSHFCIQNPA